MNPRPYEPFAYSDAPRATCAWHHPAGNWAALDGAVTTGTAIVGGGFTGLSAALHLARAGEAVTVLEAQTPGWGASGRNGGFCCLGGAMLDDAQIARRHGEDAARAFFNAQRDAIDLVAALLARHGIDAQTLSNGELVLAHRPAMVGALKREAAHLAHYGVTPQFYRREELAERGAAGPQFHAGLHVPLGFGLEPGRYAQGLADAAMSAGAVLHGHSPVTGISPDLGGFCLTTPQGSVTANRLILATNGYSSDALPPWMRARFLPVQSNILVTRPLTDDDAHAQGWTTDLMAYDTRRLLHYFRRLPDGRFLFGMRGGLRASRSSHRHMQRLTRRHFTTMFPAWAQVETPHFWSGLACLAPRLTPYIGPLGNWGNAWAGFAYHGNGVAMATWTGARLAELARGITPGMPGFLSAPPGRFPMGRQRRIGLSLAYPLARLRDGW